MPSYPLVAHAATLKTAETLEVLTLSEAARLLRVRPQEVADLTRRHCLPARRIGQQWR